MCSSAVCSFISSHHHLSLTWANPHYWTPVRPGQWWLCLEESSWRRPNLLELFWRKAACLGLHEVMTWVFLIQCVDSDNGLQTAMRCWQHIACRGSSTSTCLWLQIGRCYVDSEVWAMSSGLLLFEKFPAWLDRLYVMSPTQTAERKLDTPWLLRPRSRRR